MSSMNKNEVISTRMDDTFTELQAELQSSKFIQEVSQKAVSIDQPSVEDIPVESFAKLIIN